MSTDIDRDIKYLKNAISLHQGDTGEDVHGLPNNGEAGFMPWDLYVNNLNLFQTRKSLDANTDVFSLSPGFYCGSGLTNVPPEANAASEATIDVTVYGSVRKKIVYTECAINRTWIKLIHVPSAPADLTKNVDWVESSTVVTLFDGSLSDVSTTQTVKESFGHFQQLKIDYATSIGQRYSCFIPAATGKYTLSGFNVADGLDYMTFVNCDLTILSSTSFNLTDQFAFNIKNSDSSISASSTFKIVLKKIYGTR
ncbi:hypothetical protein [Liquorilactobacillus nagelii]|uniref:hypothetical protein n=1 Tax=Liquorilactobacillus nagelii TaxID=82688 RepID=UPI0006F1466C|nr:hypothetical protein [Liquorilactobacillus nagelii]KRL40740.1 hypothetical protein FD45_GL001384 [Liquorilactobacillus nagelii DSM 13675]QYH53702.1 hypothetical protein G6O73_02900 [Liquorilactobacillus nagelii DSM 13675]